MRAGFPKRRSFGHSVKLRGRCRTSQKSFLDFGALLGIGARCPKAQCTASKIRIATLKGGVDETVNRTMKATRTAVTTAGYKSTQHCLLRVLLPVEGFTRPSPTVRVSRPVRAARASRPSRANRPALATQPDRATQSGRKLGRPPRLWRARKLRMMKRSTSNGRPRLRRHRSAARGMGRHPRLIPNGARAPSMPSLCTMVLEKCTRTLGASVWARCLVPKCRRCFSCCAGRPTRPFLQNHYSTSS
mmetsp:Transcript_117986/g.333732  ORF Transcript_117986/g.333732 Transcript_117986/m.333732 type:complete len:245 (+) Transcript_117986:50-784(+)